MDQTAILGPLFAMIGLTFVVWVYMYVKRIHFIQTSGLTPEELAVPGRLAEASPPDVSNPSDNLKNLFELPVLFYAVVLALYATRQVDPVYLWSAWSFVGFRTLHSAMHCTANVVMVRFYLYAAASLALWLMAARAAWAWLAG
jgi:hypothetical protein